MDLKLFDVVMMLRSFVLFDKITSMWRFNPYCSQDAKMTYTDRNQNVPSSVLPEPSKTRMFTLAEARKLRNPKS